ncbi:MAG: Amuc_1098 family type IV pilus outer membrane protein [Rubritalea sp.]|uniref:Amuc_1098 family type IV pilus outer membrane protein n=1 Tax=Rubritalea sp. TaxID=2109375 RepID=UPI003242791E
MVSSILENSAGIRWVSKNLAQTCVLGIAVGAVLSSQAHAQSYDSKVAQQEIAKRSESVVLAQELLINGDAHYSKAEYEEAVSVYSQAFSIIPVGGLSKELKGAASERYAQAAVEYSKSLSRFGQYDKARQVLSNVLSPNVAKDHAGATQMLAQLDDPIRTNPVLTAQLSRDAETAGQWLRKAEGYFSLGKFDDAFLAYEEVLHLDRYNKAARRGMERVAAVKSDYAGAAYDQSREEAMMQVNSQWDIKINPRVSKLGSSVTVVDEETRTQEVYANKLRQILVPIVDLEDVSIDEAYDMIRVWSKEYDEYSLDNSKKGVNYVLNIGSDDSDWGKIIRQKRITLKLRNVPLTHILDFVSKATGTQWRYEDHAVVVTPSGSADSSIHRRTFRVPPTFMQDAGNQAIDANDDPFAEESSGGGALSARVSAKDFLKTLGVTFPDGAAAKYVPGTGSLMVSNTLQNIDIIEQYVTSYAQSENVQVVMKLTIVDVARNDLDELGFDWLLGTNNGSNVVSGGTQGSGRDITSDLSGGRGDLTPVTSGLRSGDNMFDTGLLDASVAGAASSSLIGQSTANAPGIFALRGEDFAVLMRGLNQKKSVERLVSPSIIARSGEKATLFNGREMIYATEYEPPQLPDSVAIDGAGSFPVTPATPTDFETRLVGVSLEAEATVSEDKHYIDVRIQSDVSDFEGFINYGSPITSFTTDASGGAVPVEIASNAILMPIFRSTPLNTAVTVRDGSSFVIAGLNQSSIQTVEDKVPVLGDIPLVGRFFKSEGIQKTDRVLLIFVNVELKDPTGKNWRER